MLTNLMLIKHVVYSYNAEHPQIMRKLPALKFAYQLNTFK